jgi:hypothetical protein
MRARYYNPYISRFLNTDPSGFGGGLNFYLFCNDNPISQEDPYGLQVPGPVEAAIGFGPGYGQSIGAYNSQVQAVSQQALAIEGSVGAGAAIGAGGAIAITFGAPLAYTGLTTLGLSPAAASATLTTTLGIGGIVGGGLSVYNTANDVSAGNLNAVGFDLGTFWGGGFVGGVGGGRYIANNTSPSASTVPYSMNPFTADEGYGFQRNSDLPLGTDLWNWLGTGPTPSGGGGAAMFISSGAISLSPTGK